MSGLTIDRASLLAELRGDASLAACEEALRAEGLTLGLEGAVPAEEKVGAWLAAGAPGARDPWSDPADHLVAGLDVTLRGGQKLAVLPAPRRAVGPDLIALVVGMGERFARVERAWLRVHLLGAPRPSAHPFVADRNPAVTGDEAALLDRIEAALRS